MKLKEFESLTLLESEGILAPNRFIIHHGNLNDIKEIKFNKLVVKAQTLNKKRKKSGFIKICSPEELEVEIKELLEKDFKGEKVNEVLVEDFIEHNQENYIGFLFDSQLKSPVIILSNEGGVDIEEVKKNFPDKILIEKIDPLERISMERALSYASKAGFKQNLKEVAEFIIKAYSCFEKNDATLLEINPFVFTVKEEIMALDCNICLDDSALSRHNFTFPERIGLREASMNEIRAREIDKEDYRGTAGKTYIDLNGDIAVLASGGGASLTAMDALIKYGGKPANYTEYSGNPSAEKVKKLTEITLSKKNLSGCFVIGGTANFTDIYETLKGFIEGLKLINPKPDYPIVIRRAGPRDKEAYEMIRNFAKEENIDIHLFDESTSITYPAKIMVSLSNNYKEKKNVDIN